MTPTAGRALAFAIFLLALPTGAVAQDPEPSNEELRRFGLSVGNAYACVDDGARSAMRQDAHAMFDMIIKDLGSDAAFTFATSAGYGASLDRAGLDCARLLSQWEDSRQSFGLASGAR